MVGLASAQATRPRPDLNRIKMVLSENVPKKPIGKTFSILLHTSNGHRFGVTPFKSAILGDLRSIATGGQAKKVPLRIAHQQRFGTFVHLQCAQGLVLSWDGGYPEMVCLSQGKGHSNIEKNWGCIPSWCFSLVIWFLNWETQLGKGTQKPSDSQGSEPRWPPLADTCRAPTGQGWRRCRCGGRYWPTTWLKGIPLHLHIMATVVRSISDSDVHPPTMRS